MTAAHRAGAARVQVRRRGAVLHLLLEHPPVNSLPQPMRLALWRALEAADADASVRAIVLAGTGRGFSAGGDYRELRSPLQQAWPALSNHLFPRIEACAKPVVAAIHGFAVGGGFELALACHHRVAQRDARIALPELKHGVLPPSGSQRLPRAVGVARSLELILSAEAVRADAYADTPLFDRLCDGGDVVAQAHDVAAALTPVPGAAEAPELTPGAAAAPNARPHPAAALLRHRPVDARGAAEAIRDWRARVEARPDAGPALRGCIAAVEHAVNAPDFDTGLAAAKRLHDALSGPATAMETP